MCSLRLPNCPQGFHWIQTFDAISCFKTFGKRVTFYEQNTESSTIREIDSFWTYENECSKFGSRLAVIESMTDVYNIAPWLYSQHSFNNGYILGMKINSYFTSSNVSFTSTNRSDVNRTISFYQFNMSWDFQVQ